MSKFEFPVWVISRAVLALPFRYPLALLKFGALPLLIAMVCLPPPVNVGHSTTVTVDGVEQAPVGETLSTTDNQFGLRDLIGFALMLPFAASFAAAWSRLAATGDESAMGRPPMALDGRTVSVIWAFIRLLGLVSCLLLALFLASLLFFGHTTGIFPILITSTSMGSAPRLPWPPAYLSSPWAPPGSCCALPS